VDSWLDRSGYGRRMAVASLGLPLGSLLVFVALRAARWTRSGWILFLLLVAGFGLASANPILLALMRCRVCGLRVPGSSFARAVPRSEREAWLSRLEACPCCGDNGTATLDSRARWRASGLIAERPYWSPLRVFVAILGTLLFILGGMELGSRIRP
jgi:hypothetical protein